MAEFDIEAMQGGVEGYLERSREIFNLDFLEYAEGELEKLQTKHGSGFSFPTNEGMRKITKHPEMNKLENDPVLSDLIEGIRTTIRGITVPKQGGIYAGMNAFHHGHVAYLSKSEAVVAVDYNKLVPYGFSFIVGLVGGAKTPEAFRKQVGAMAANPRIFEDVFVKTGLGRTALLNSEAPEVVKARERLLRGFVEVMDEFDPLVHGKDRIPPVFCTDPDSYNYFRTLVLQDKVAGAKSKLQGEGFMNILAKSIDAFKVSLPEVNTVYTSSCFDPRFLGAKERGVFLARLKKNGFSNVQLVESFLNSGWIVYDVR